MPNTNYKTAHREKTKRTPRQDKSQRTTPHDLTRYEFYRNAIALLPEPGDRNPGVAIMTMNP